MYSASRINESVPKLIVTTTLLGQDLPMSNFCFLILNCHLLDVKNLGPNSGSQCEHEKLGIIHK
jgi:hypothetical protein